MKMTMHIDEAVLEEVMETFGFETKTDAVNTALREMVRKKKLKEMLKNGLGLTPEELKNSVDPDYDPIALRVADTPSDYLTGDGKPDPR